MSANGGEFKKELFDLQPGDSPDARMRAFIDRLLQFQQYAERERGAYGLFTRIALATLSGDGEPIVEEDDDPRHIEKGYQDSKIYFPPINYEPDPSDSSTRRQIVLKLSRLSRYGRTTTITPWLEVYRMEAIKKYGPDVSHAEVGFVRTDVEVLMDHRDGDDANLLFDTMLSEGREAEFQERLMMQDEYVGWLNIAATALGIPSAYQEAFVLPETTAHLN